MKWVQGLRHAGGKDVSAVADEALVSVCLEDNDGDVVSAVPTTLSPQWVEKVVLDDLANAESLFLRVWRLKNKQLVVTDLALL